MTNKANRFAGRSKAFMAVYKIARPLAHVMLHQGLPAHEAIEALKLAFVETVEKNFSLSKDASTSRIAILTGFNRTDVARIRDGSGARSDAYYNRAQACAIGWHNDKDFHDGKFPADLTLKGEKSFTTLVKKYSGGITPKQILEELLLAKMVEKNSDGSLHLIKPHYDQMLGIGDKDDVIIEVIGNHTAGMLTTMLHNVMHPENKRIQRRLDFRSLTDEQTASLNELAMQCRQEMFDKLNQWHDELPASDGTDGDHEGRHTGIGIHYYDYEDKQ